MKKGIIVKTVVLFSNRDQKTNFDGKLFYICQYVKDKFGGTELGEKRLSVSKR